MKHILVIVLVLVMAACGGGTEDTPTPGTGPNGRVFTPIPEAPEWQQPGEVINRENVAQAHLIGRLDVRDTPSTLFDYAFSPDGTSLAGLNNDQLVAWDLITGQRTISTSRNGASYIYYSPDKTEIYTIDPQGAVQVYDSTDGSSISDFVGHSDFSGARAFYGDTGWLALGGYDGTVKVWDTFERRSLVTIDAHDRDVSHIVFSDDGTLLATASSDEVKIWNWQTRELLVTLDNNDAVVRRMTFSPDGTRLAVGANTFVGVWQVSDGLFLYSLQPGAGGASDVLMYSPDGRYLLSGGAVPDMIVWDAINGELVALLPGLGGDATSAAFSPDGNLLLASVLDGAVTLWDMTNITNETVVRADLEVGTSRVLNVAFSPDGFTMLFFDAVGPVYVWGIAG